jgi:hypothetical protein
MPGGELLLDDWRKVVCEVWESFIRSSLNSMVLEALVIIV